MIAEDLGEYSRRFATGEAPAGVYLTAGEVAALESLTDTGDLVSVPVTRGDTVADHRWPDPPDWRFHR